MNPPAQQQQDWPWGPSNDLHNAACHGYAKHTITLLARGSIDIDQGDPKGWTPLMFAAQSGHSHVARILLNRRANVCIGNDDGYTALHFSAQSGHLAVTTDLIKAGADLEVRTAQGVSPLHLASMNDHSEVILALIDAGADADGRAKDGRTPLYLAALGGCLDAVKELLRANANPLLAFKDPWGTTLVPLDKAACNGHLEVCELIGQVGIEGCGGETGGANALKGAAIQQQFDIMAVLMGAGVVDTGGALLAAVGWGREASVKFLLQGAPADSDGYANFRDQYGCTPLFRGIDGSARSDGVPYLISPTLVRLLIDAGADTSSVVRIIHRGEVLFNDTPLAFINDILLKKKMTDGEDATEEQLYRLEAVRGLLLRVEAVHAVSWLWAREPPLNRGAAEVACRTTRKTLAQGTQWTVMLPILRRRRRGVLLAPLFRYSSSP